MTIYNWSWLSVEESQHFKPEADIVGSFLVAPALLLPPLVALLVLFQHRSDLSSVLKPTQYWRKNALKQNKKDKYRGEERTFRYNMRGEQLERERINDSVVDAIFA